jgi:hypothetical protein
MSRQRSLNHVPNLQSFNLIDMMALRAQIRSAFDLEPVHSFEQAAQRMTTLLRTNLLDGDGAPACALVRVFKTQLLSTLDDELKAWALARMSDADVTPATRCLVLLGSDGVEPAWQSRHGSQGHKAIPMADAGAVAQIPMVAQLIRQLGLDVNAVLRPDERLLLTADNRTDGVFHIAEAVGSAYIPAQSDFVRPYGVKSVLGFGGMLTSGDLVAAILFSTVPVSDAVANHFRIIGLNFKLAVLPYALKPTFARPTPPVRG